MKVYAVMAGRYEDVSTVAIYCDVEMAKLHILSGVRCARRGYIDAITREEVDLKTFRDKPFLPYRFAEPHDRLCPGKIEMKHHTNAWEITCSQGEDCSRDRFAEPWIEEWDVIE